MKKLTVTLALLLCLVLCVFAFSSCGKKKKGGPADTTGEATAATTSKWPAIGAEVSAFAAEDRTLKIQYDMSSQNGEKIPTNDKYIKGPDSLDGADSIGEKIYERNNTAKELFGLTIEYTYWDEFTWGKQAGKIKEVVDAADAPDLFIDMLYDLNLAMKTKNVFKDLWSLPGSYYDFTAEGWMKDWMESLSFTGDRAYILGSDYFIDILRAMGVLPFNMTLMNGKGNDLAPALFGADNGLSAGETMSARFFDFVDNGQWTWDALKKLCEAVWADSDGDGQNSYDDVLGIVSDRYTGLPAALMVYSSGVSLTETYQINDEANEYNGKTWVRYNADSTALGTVFDAVAKVFTGQGAFVTNYTPDTGKNMSEHYVKFSGNTLLFAGPVILGALEDKAFQQRTIDWSVVPIPKVSADKKYNTVIHNIADAGAVNVNTTPGKARALSAFLQYCSENSGEIKDEFLQIVTKYKTAVYDQGTDRMLDLIYSSVITGRDKAFEDVAEGTNGKSSSSLLKGSQYTGGSDYIVERYQTLLSEKQGRLDAILKTWYQLPTASSEASGTSETPAQ